ncbi:MAG TPA: NlpC/P60 family protein [Candidatus Limnocylindrales bacterium]|nr:NlpC/P60 family protein [Candidatus Limnocylindrales bacterium]
MRALRIALPVFVAALLLAAWPAGNVSANTPAQAVVDFARSQIGKPYRYGTNGLSTYDCSGLVWRSFRVHGLQDLIGGARSSAGYFNWFRERGQLTSSPRPGDLVVWGNPVSHVGIYSGTSGGHPMAISALTSGVREHRVHAVTTPFRAYLRVAWGSAEATGSTTPATASTTLPAPFATTMNLRRGSHTLYRLDGSGQIVQQRTINRSSALKVNVDRRIQSHAGRPHARITSGTWADWWRRVPDAAPSCCRHRFATTRTLRLEAGTHLFKTFHADRNVVIREHIRVGQATHLRVDVRATFNGKRHFLVAGGPMAGKWVAKTTRSRLVP